MATTTESALQVKELSPSLTVNDVPKNVTFFEALGFAVEERWEDNGGITLDSQPHDTGWGGRAFDVTEPSGFKVTVAAL